MNRPGSFILIAVLLLCYQAVPGAETAVAVEPRDTLVMVTRRSVMGRFAGSGFVIGNGTLVVTAHHLVFEESEQGQHEMGGMVFAASPYLGEGADARVVAADRELDLAILEVPWKGHPALRLADESSVLSAERLIVTGIPEMVRNVATGGHEPSLEHLDGQAEDMTVDFVAVRRNMPRFISLSEVGRLAPGWSGSPGFWANIAPKPEAKP